MNIREIKSWQDFLSKVEIWIKDGPNGPNIFRGQADDDWELTPYLTRLLNQYNHTPETSLDIEEKILIEFQKRYKERDIYTKKLEGQDVLSWWELMQHHSWPTRLLDWTKDPFISLYFAVSEFPEKNGAFFVADVGHLQWIQSHRAKDPVDKPNWGAFEEIDKAVNREPYTPSMVVISAPNPTDRMESQQSSFTLSTEILEPHNKTGDDIVFDRIINRTEIEPSIFYKFIISKELKQELSTKLKEIGLSVGKIFPDTRVMDDDIENAMMIIKNILKNGAS